MKRVALFAIASLLSGCAIVGPPVAEDAALGRLAGEPAFTLRLIGEQRLGHRLQFDGTTVGGLSGIDYDPVDDLYYLISDDRSGYAPNRFYTARLRIDESGFHDASLQGVVFLKRPDGEPYARDEADSEAIRFDPRTRSLWWTSEGLRKIGGHGRPRLIDPFIRRSTVDGRYVGEVPLAPMFHITDAPRGPRDNLVFEGATLSPDGRSLWVSMEAPLIEDGPLPTLSMGAWLRFSRYERDGTASQEFGPLATQYAYRIDPIPSERALIPAYALNGVSEILMRDASHLLVLERALVIGGGWRIRLFDADLDGASDVKDIASLAGRDTKGGLPFMPMEKRLVYDFDDLHRHVDNLEGLCFGPTLPNGHRTLVLVADDNFNALQTTQLLAFEIVPR